MILMNLIELRDRLSEIIEENSKNGWADRNQQQVVCSVERRTPTGRHRSRRFPILYASSALVGDQKSRRFFELIVKESNEYK